MAHEGGCQSGGHKNSCYTVSVPCHVGAVGEKVFIITAEYFPFEGDLMPDNGVDHQEYEYLTA